MTMKVSAGWARGMPLATPAGLATRPTRERIRQAILNMIGPELEGMRVLDLFAGSGALGLEAVSRGAAGAVLVEQGREALVALRANAAELGRRAERQGRAGPAVEVVGRDVRSVLGDLRARGPFDLVVADPPYAQAAALLEQLGAGIAALLAPHGRLAYESGRGSDAAVAAAAAATGLGVVKQRAYGETLVTLCARAEATAAARPAARGDDDA
jgi:16S rRNA (guanine966-N2)-methyltransferase